MENLYYQAPSDEMFNEVKEKAIEVWQSYDNYFGYADEKVGRIKDIKNVGDNFMYMVAMFDSSNQLELSLRLKSETKKAIADRMVAGGTPPEYIVF